MLHGTLRAKKETGRVLIKKTTVRHRTELGDQECNIVVERNLGREMDIDPEGMEIGPGWEVSHERIS